MGKKIPAPPTEGTKPKRRKKPTESGEIIKIAATRNRKKQNHERSMQSWQHVAKNAEPNQAKRDRRQAAFGEGMIGGRVFRRGLKNLQRRKANFEAAKGHHMPGSRKKH